MNARRHIGCLAAALCVTAAAGCGGGPSSLQIGVRRVGVDLAFQADKDAAAKKPPQVVYVDAPPPPMAAPIFTRNAKNEIIILQPPVVPPVVVKCPKAPPGTPVEKIATPIFQGVPKVGKYEVRNKGKIDLSGVFPVSLPYPSPTEQRIENLSTDVRNAAGLPIAGAFEYDLVTPAGGDYTTNRLRTTPGSGVELVKRTYKTGDTTVVFNPLKPVKLIGLTSGEGDSWTDATSDPISGISFTTQGQVLARERVDLCGTVVDSYRVKSTERLVSLNPASPFASTTMDANPNQPGEPNYYLVSPQLAGIFVQVETHTATTIGAVTVTVNNVGTLSSLDPRPLA